MYQGGKFSLYSVCLAPPAGAGIRPAETFDRKKSVGVELCHWVVLGPPNMTATSHPNISIYLSILSPLLSLKFKTHVSCGAFCLFIESFWQKGRSGWEAAAAADGNIVTACAAADTVETPRLSMVSILSPLNSRHKLRSSAANRLIGEVVQSRRRPLESAY